MNTTTTELKRSWMPLLHAMVFALAVLGVGTAMLGKLREFAPKPDRQALDGHATQAFEHEYDQHFPARNFGIGLWSAIDYVLFHEAQTGVVLGRDGWLYTDEEFSLVNDADRVVGRNLAMIDHVRNTLAARHIALLVAIVPAKARIYAEHLRGRRPPALQRGLYDRAQAALAADGIVHPDLRATLAAGKATAPTFLRTDTHWTPYGADLAAQTIAAPVRRLLPAPDTPAAYTTTPLPARKHRGDLFNFLPLDPYFGWLLPPADLLVSARTEAAGSGDLLGGGQTPRIALVGTSYSANPAWNFAGALEQSLGEDVANYAKDGGGPFQPMDAYLHGRDFAISPPRLVIWEMPERYLAMPQKDATLAPAIAAAAGAAKPRSATTPFIP